MRCAVRKVVPLKFPKTLKLWGKKIFRTPESGSLRLFAREAMTTTNSKQSVQAEPSLCHSPLGPHSDCVGQVGSYHPPDANKELRLHECSHSPWASRRKAHNRASHLSSPFQWRLALERLWTPFFIQCSSSSYDRATLPAPGPQPLRNISQTKDSTEQDLGSPNSGQFSHFTEEQFRPGREMSRF